MKKAGRTHVFVEVVLVDVLDGQAEHLGRELAHLGRQSVALLELRVRPQLLVVLLVVGRSAAALLLATLRQLPRRLLLLTNTTDNVSLSFQYLDTRVAR